MFSAKFAQSVRIPKSIPEQPKGPLASGRPMWGSGVPCFAEIVSGAVEAAGGAEGAVGLAQAARPGRHFCLSAQTVLGALRVSVAGCKCMGTWGWATSSPLPWGWDLVHQSWDGQPHWAQRKLSNVSLQTELYRRSWVLLAAGTALNPTRQHHTSFIEFCPRELGLQKCAQSVDAKLFSS